MSKKWTNNFNCRNCNHLKWDEGSKPKTGRCLAFAPCPIHADDDFVVRCDNYSPKEQTDECT